MMQTDLANDETALDAVKHSVEAASAAVSALGLRRSEAPSTTIVSAVVSDQQIAIAWIGDSRAYWITQNHAHQLTSDHSWLNMVLQNGEVDRSEAQRSRNVHALTRWLGLDSDPGDPDTVVHSIDTEGIVLLCSDGLWNYAESDEAMNDLVQQSSQKSGTALELARRLVEYAIAQGGRDNITAVVMRRSAALAPENSL
jgi:serine/threonine protein phosphatase PrpC